MPWPDGIGIGLKPNQSITYVKGLVAGVPNYVNRHVGRPRFPLQGGIGIAPIKNGSISIR